MAPKPKDIAKKPVQQIMRPEISNATINFVPTDAVEGYQKRIETGIEWTLSEEAVRFHKQQYDKVLNKLFFSQALRNKIKKSILNGFLDENSKVSLKDQWELMLPIIMWDNDKFANEDSKICFRNNNCITDDIMNLIKKAVQLDDRKALENDFKKVTVLRINDSQMTSLDKTLTEFTNLVRLNLCGNFLSDIEANFIPRNIKSLELQANFISNVESFASQLPTELIYLGLAKNFLSNETLEGLDNLPKTISVLDLSDNDICDLELLLNTLATLPRLTSLQLAGNPCSLCTAYAKFTLRKLPRLQWLDLREILPTDRPEDDFELHPDDLRSTYFNIYIFRIMSVPQPPKTEKGATTSFHVEMELPLLDATRRMFLMFRQNESLIEILPQPEDDAYPPSNIISTIKSKTAVDAETTSQESDIYNRLSTVNSRQIFHFTRFESNRVQWNKVMNFQDPAIRLFCPNLFGLRDTFRSILTLKLIYTVSVPTKQTKSDKKSMSSIKPPAAEQRATIATIKCALKQPDWSQTSQHFHWDDSLGTNDAIHWGDGDLSVLQYSQVPAKVTKGKMENDSGPSRQQPPENLTCHFGFGVDSLRP